MSSVTPCLLRRPPPKFVSPRRCAVRRQQVVLGWVLGKGLRVLLGGVTASFLSNDEFGHDDGNRAIFDKFFG